MSDANAILLLSCPDRKGLVAAVSNFIFRHNGNIVYTDYHISRLQAESRILVHGAKTVSLE